MYLLRTKERVKTDACFTKTCWSYFVIAIDIWIEWILIRTCNGVTPNDTITNDGSIANAVRNDATTVANVDDANAIVVIC